MNAIARARPNAPIHIGFDPIGHTASDGAQDGFSRHRVGAGDVEHFDNAGRWLCRKNAPLLIMISLLLMLSKARKD